LQWKQADLSVRNVLTLCRTTRSIEQASSENLAHGKASVGLPIHGHELDGDGEEQEQIGIVKAVQDDGRQERVSYQCKTCDRSFSRAYNMKTHMLKKHLDSAVMLVVLCSKLQRASKNIW
jgi:hypothetical protein